MLANSISQFINVDSAFKESPIPDVTAEDIESLVSMLAFRNFDSVEKRLHFVLELYTCEPSFWTKLAAICSGAYFLKTEQEWVLVFPATIDCGYVRTYRFRPRILTVSPEEYCQNIRTIQNSEVLYGLLDTPVAQHVFNEWEKANSETVTLPTEFVNGRLANTSVERAIILKRGDGCVICGSVANFCAATTIGDSERAIMIQLPVCLEHLNEAKSYPSVFSFFAFLFHLSIDINDLEKSPNIPDELIPAIHSIVAVELQGRIGSAGKREKGWHLWVELETGWKWLLRLNSLTDYAYMLYEPDVRRERYRADSVSHHPELKFFPNHEHSAPNRNRDKVNPSFLYGIPLLDVKRLREVGKKFGAYPQSGINVTA